MEKLAPAEQPRDQRQNNADQKARNDREIETAAPAFDTDVSRQAAEIYSKPFSENDGEAYHEQHNSRVDEQAPHVPRILPERDRLYTESYRRQFAASG